MKRLIAALLFVNAVPAHADDALVPYPDNYRMWQHVKSMVIQPGHALFDAFGGIHHIYANLPAVAGYAKGKFPEGSVIVFDLLAVTTDGNAIAEGERKVVGVMHKDSKKFKTTGGWGYEGFAGNSRDQRAVGKNAESACHSCHTPQKDHDFVFSRARD